MFPRMEKHDSTRPEFQEFPHQYMRFQHVWSLWKDQQGKNRQHAA